MKKYKWYLLIASMLLLTSILSCKKLISVPPPQTKVVTVDVFANDNTAIATQLAVYAQMQAYLNVLEYQTGLSSDELSTTATSQYLKDLYSNSAIATEAVIGGVGAWANSYNLIYQENAIIEGLNSTSSKVSPAVKQHLTGEAEFTRAFIYFYLVNLYGDVPLTTSTNYSVNANLARTPTPQVYDHVINDLQSAQSLLSNNFYDATDTVITAQRVRPISAAATALLARVYLYKGDYPNAENAANLVINNSTMFSLVQNLNGIFLMNSNEAIWQIMSQSGKFYASEGGNFVLTAPPATGNARSFLLSNQLYTGFEAGDKRFTSWIGTYTQGTTTWYFPYKYKDGITSTALHEYSMILRLAEQYLIRADARAQQNNLSGAIADLNMIRQRAGLANLPSGLNQTQVLAAVAQERRIELFTENCDRWFNLKRTGTIDAVMGLVTPQKGGGSWNVNQKLYPIPLETIQTDGNVIQNTGY